MFVGNDCVGLITFFGGKIGEKEREREREMGRKKRYNPVWSIVGRISDWGKSLFALINTSCLCFRGNSLSRKWEKDGFVERRFLILLRRFTVAALGLLYVFWTFSLFMEYASSSCDFYFLEEQGGW